MAIVWSVIQSQKNWTISFYWLNYLVCKVILKKVDFFHYISYVNRSNWVNFIYFFYEKQNFALHKIKKKKKKHIARTDSWTHTAQKTGVSNKYTTTILYTCNAAQYGRLFSLVKKVYVIAYWILVSVFFYIEMACKL